MPRIIGRIVDQAGDRAVRVFGLCHAGLERSGVGDVPLNEQRWVVVFFSQIVGESRGVRSSDEGDFGALGDKSLSDGRANARSAAGDVDGGLFKIAKLDAGHVGSPCGGLCVL